MKNTEQSNVTIKSNVTLKSREIIRPMDNIKDVYSDVRYRNLLTEDQKSQLIRSLYYT